MSALSLLAFNLSSRLPMTRLTCRTVNTTKLIAIRISESGTYGRELSCLLCHTHDVCVKVSVRVKEKGTVVFVRKDASLFHQNAVVDNGVMLLPRPFTVDMRKAGQSFEIFGR